MVASLPACWENRWDLVTFDVSENKSSFSRWLQILRSCADLAHLDWRGEVVFAVPATSPWSSRPTATSVAWWAKAAHEKTWRKQGEVQAGPFWNSHSMWVEVIVLLEGWEGTSLSHYSLWAQEPGLQSHPVSRSTALFSTAQCSPYTAKWPSSVSQESCMHFPCSFSLEYLLQLLRNTDT